MQAKELVYQDSLISYYCFGKGPQPVICFHGYGELARSYLFLEKYAGDDFTFYSIDLPFHGRTNWKENKDFTYEILLDIIKELLSTQQQGNEKLILLGYSLGGRIAISLYQNCPEKTKGLFLLAPDGLKVNVWYWLATQTFPGNRFFAFTMKHPKWFFMILKVLNRLGTVNTSIFKFVNYYIGDNQMRYLLYTRWTVLRKFKPDLKKSKKLIEKYKTPVHLIYGKHDRIILPVRGEKFRKGIEQSCKITILDTGHQVLQEKYVDLIVKTLKEIRKG